MTNCARLLNPKMDQVKLDELQVAACKCQRCGLAARRTNVVFGEGSALSPLLLVGEGPGAMEDKLGRPFVGRAGQLLDKAIIEGGLSREMIYIANTVKCRAADWQTGKPVNRPPTESEIESCHPWLRGQIELIKPLVILCIGAPSARTIIKKNFKITQERGLFFECSLARAALATLHPSYILRQANLGGDGGYSLLVADLKKGWDTALRLKEAGKHSPFDAPESSGTQAPLF